MFQNSILYVKKLLMVIILQLDRRTYTTFIHYIQLYILQNKDYSRVKV